MPLGLTENHHSFSAEYQISGIPFVLTSGDTDLTVNLGNVVQVVLPQVSQWVVVQHTGGGTGALRVGFTDNGIRGVENEHYFLVPNGDKSDPLHVRCRNLFFANDGVTGNSAIGFSLIAGLTSVPKFLHLTGSVDRFEGVG